MRVRELGKISYQRLSWNGKEVIEEWKVFQLCKIKGQGNSFPLGHLHFKGS